MAGIWRTLCGDGGHHEVHPEVNLQVIEAAAAAHPPSTCRHIPADTCGILQTLRKPEQAKLGTELANIQYPPSSKKEPHIIHLIQPCLRGREIQAPLIERSV